MYKHDELLPRELHALIRRGKLTLAGNKSLKIYGTFSCVSGRRMNIQNRLFFKDENEAVEMGFRPCGNCMKTAYGQWKLRKKQVE